MWENVFPKSSDNFKGFTLGLQAYKIGDFKGAVKVFTKLTEREPKVSFCWYVILESLSYLGKWEEMIKIGEKGRKFHPKNGPIYIGLGEAYSKLEKRKQSIKLYKKGLKLLETDLVRYPNDETVLNFLGEINIRLGNYEEAIEFSQRAANINPKSENHLHGIGLAYKEKRDYDNAIAFYEKSLDVNPKHSYAWFDLGLIYENLNDSEKAIECYEKAVENSPQWVKLREKLIEVKPDSIALLKKPPDIRTLFDEKIAQEHTQSESIFRELTEVSKLLEESELTEEEKKYHKQRKLELTKDIKYDLVPREEKLAELKKLLAESIELSIKINNESNNKKKDELYTQLRDLAKLVENKRLEIYKTKKSFEEAVTTYYMELGPKDARTLWESMKMSTTDYNELMDLMRQETDFYKKMIAIGEESFKKADKFDEYRPKGIIEKIAWKKTKKEMEKLEEKNNNNQT